MKIQLDLIHPSPHPIRSIWDEEKMNELAASIKEQGLIVPIKVRPMFEPCPHHGVEWFDANADRIDELVNCPGCSKMLTETEDEEGEIVPAFEIVYGHRRVEAARRAGLEEIEAIVEGMEDDEAQWQAFIENMQREDLKALDIAEACKERRDAGYSDEEIAQRAGWSNATMVRNYTAMLNVAKPLQDILQNNPDIDQTTFSRSGAGGLSKEPELRAAVLNKTVKEGLTQEQVRKVAESVAATKDPRMREQLINAPYSPYTHDPELARERATRYGEYDPMARVKAPSAGVLWEATTEVTMLLDYLQTSRKMAEEAIKMDELGKFAPEAREFVARKAKLMVDAWQQVIDRLGG